jgi:hypothetical protein
MAKGFLYLLLAVAAGAFAAYAQSTFGSISGTVSDPSGAVITGAQISALEVNTGVAHSVLSGSDGVYTLADILPGTYRLTVSAKGFDQFERPGIVLFAGQNINVDARLTVGGTETRITVNVAPPVIDTETATTSFTKTGQHLDDTPLLMRQSHSDLGFAVYNPGAGVNGSANIFANGARQLDAYMSTEGIVEMADPDGVGGGQISPALDSIAEITYTLANSPAEFKTPVEYTMVTKSGTNQFHGGAFYEYNDGGAMNARTFFASTIPFHIYNDYALYLGGPIRRNKTFFFFDMESESNHTETVVTDNTPLVPWRTGNFGSTTVKNPFTGAAFPNNQIPTSLINPVALAAQNYFYPLPDYGAATLQAGNWRGIHKTRGTPKVFDWRVDQNFGEHDAVFGRSTYRPIGSITGSAYMPPLGTGVQQRNSSTAIISWTHTFSPGLINEARGGFARNYNRYYPDLIGSDILSQIGLPGISTQGIHGLPYFTISGLTGTNQSSDGLSLDTDFQVTDNVSWIHAGHAMKFGLDAIRDQIGGYTVPNIYGTYNFTGTYSGSAYADFLLGLPQTVGLSIPTPNQYQRGTMWAMYAQDQWKATPRLTLTYGLRWELPGPYYDKYGRIFSFNPANGSLVLPDNGIASINPFYPNNIPVETATQAGYPNNTLIQFRKLNFYPRTGLAYKITADGKTAVRAGYGIYGDTIYGSIAQSLVGGPFSGSETITNSLTNGTPLVTLSNPFGGAGKTAALQNVTGINPDIAVPYTQQWNVTLERQLGSIAFSAAYIGSHSVGLLYPRNLNQPLPSLAKFSGYLYPGLNTITWVENGGGETYNSMQLSATKTLGKGLTFQSAFTWAHDMTDQLDSGNFDGQLIQNAYNRDVERGNNTYTVRLRWFTDVVYAIPVGAGQRFLNQMPRVANAVLGGWRLSSTMMLQTGQYFTPSFAGADPSNTNHPGGRPDVIPGVSTVPAGGQSIADWVNLNAFEVPGCPTTTPVCGNPASLGRFGDAGNNILAGPPMRNVDLALQKDFHPVERILLNFEVQATNAFNHPNFGNPSANISSPATGAVITATLTNYLQGSGAARAIYVMLRLKF